MAATLDGPCEAIDAVSPRSSVNAASTAAHFPSTLPFPPPPTLESDRICREYEKGMHGIGILASRA
jgi:hypothetical protein